MACKLGWVDRGEQGQMNVGIKYLKTNEMGHRIPDSSGCSVANSRCTSSASELYSLYFSCSSLILSIATACSPVDPSLGEPYLQILYQNKLCAAYVNTLKWNFHLATVFWGLYFLFYIKLLPSKWSWHLTVNILRLEKVQTTVHRRPICWSERLMCIINAWIQ